MNGKGRPRLGEGGEPLRLRHGRGSAGGPGQHQRLPDFGHGQLAFEGRCRGREGGNAGRDRVGDAERIEAPQLLAHSAPDREIAGMETRHVLAPLMRPHVLRRDGIEIERCGVDEPRAGRAPGQHLRRHDGSGIEADGTAFDERTAPHRDEIGSTGTCSDEMDFHGRVSRRARAQVAEGGGDALDDEAGARPCGRKCRRFRDRSDSMRRDGARGLRAHVRRRRGEGGFGHRHRRHVEPARRFLERRRLGERRDGREPVQCIARKGRALKRQLHESHDLVCGDAAPESHPCHDHGFVTTHCVTGIAARQPCMPPTGSRRETARRRMVPPCCA